MATDERVRFKYELVARNGQRQGGFSEQGVVERDRLVLGDEEIALDSVLRAVARYDVLEVSVVLDDGQAGSVTFAVTSGSLRDVRAAAAGRGRGLVTQKLVDHRGMTMRVAEFLRH